MIVRIDQSLGVPIYQQVRDQVVAAIAAGELVEGDALPSVRALAVDLGINLHTVNKAYALLRDDGYLVVRGRAGAFVAQPMRTRRWSCCPGRPSSERGALCGGSRLRCGRW